MDKKRTKGKKRHIGLWITLAVVLIIVLLIVDSSYRLVNTEYTLEYSTLPEAFDDFTIVQISDLHMAEFGEDNKNLVTLTKQQEPDIIAITGDLLSARSHRKEGQVEMLRGFLDALTDVAPCYFVSGNHDWASGDLEELTDLLEEMGVTYLRNEYETLSRDGAEIVLTGVEDPNGYADQKTPEELTTEIAEEKPGEFVLLLAHREYWVQEYPELQADLILAGHAHGGVFRLPFVGALVGHGGEWFPNYTGGVYTSGRYQMVVSKGLGNLGWIPRFCNNPEIVTIELDAA